jgi:O-6-methylguanine DNA methyltransferase
MSLAQRSLRTPIGVLRVTASERGVTNIDRVATKSNRVARQSSQRGRQSAQRGTPAAQRQADRAVRELREYFAGKRTRFTVPVQLEGTPFQERAWATMRKIPFGRTMSYAEQATEMRAPRAVRAVGSANGANPVPIIVPCHRVVASNGGLGGYALGLAMKRWLLAHESRP